jgi:hypothetical protein
LAGSAAAALAVIRTSPRASPAGASRAVPALSVAPCVPTFDAPSLPTFGPWVTVTMAPGTGRPSASSTCTTIVRGPRFEAGADADSFRPSPAADGYR